MVLKPFKTRKLKIGTYYVPVYAKNFSLNLSPVWQEKEIGSGGYIATQQVTFVQVDQIHQLPVFQFLFVS